MPRFTPGAGRRCVEIPKARFSSSAGYGGCRAGCAAGPLPAGARAGVAPWPYRALWLLQCQRKLGSTLLFYLLSSKLQP